MPGKSVAREGMLLVRGVLVRGFTVVSLFIGRFEEKIQFYLKLWPVFIENDVGLCQEIPWEGEDNVDFDHRKRVLRVVK